MSKEAANTLKEDQSLKAGLKVSAKYGPAVEIEASAEGSISRNKEEVTKSATKFSQDVTDRTVKKITERVLQRQSTVTINEVVEVNEHGINNENGTGHISGVYQWLNKRYEAQVFNYGLRMMFEFMIPEPAAFLTYALSTTVNSAEAGLLLEKPSPFELKPADITEEAIGPLIAKYQALDVLPPPEDYITVSDQAKVGGGDVNTNYDHGAIISIPAGYQAIYATVSSVKNIWEKANVCLDIMVGGETVRFGDLGLDSWGTSLLNNVDGGSIAAGGNIAWAFNTFGIPDCVVSVEILCRVTDRRKQQWQAETHAKLLAAYKARLSEYEEKLARLKLETGVNIQGTNPAANLITIKAELKKSCISVLTAQHYDLFNSISKNPKHGYPEVNLYQAEAEGSYVRFFEQAFEWDQIMYITYPYFWGRQDTWIKKMTFNDTDPVFDEFLKAGFARVVVPARPGFEGAIDHFMQLGEIWNGGPLPSITSKLYVPIADEVSERARKPQGEIPQGEPWEVTIPTTLVKLKADDSLPTF
ncbi:hypothetical protein FRC17_005445 [Serendipita sp. 399]|nr:hypothetical protein FRC17_005445 [Serendipita sp. 399]